MAAWRSDSIDETKVNCWCHRSGKYLTRSKTGSFSTKSLSTFYRRQRTRVSNTTLLNSKSQDSISEVYLQNVGARGKEKALFPPVAQKAKGKRSMCCMFHASVRRSRSNLGINSVFRWKKEKYFFLSLRIKKTKRTSCDGRREERRR